MKAREWAVGHRGGEGTGFYDDSGIYHPAPGAESFDEGPCHTQAGGEAIARRSSGTPEKQSEGTVFLRPRQRALRYQPEDSISLLYAPYRERGRVIYLSAEAKVNFVRPEDGAVLVTYQ